ncbi:hypothetical protein LCGC14_1964600, partial [marine sediment metagenome]
YKIRECENLQGLRTQIFSGIISSHGNRDWIGHSVANPEERRYNQIERQTCATKNEEGNAKTHDILKQRDGTIGVIPAPKTAQEPAEKPPQ